MDELTLTLPRKIREETRKGVEAAGGAWASTRPSAIVDRMVELGRKGRSSGAGFYEYDETASAPASGRACASEFARRRDRTACRSRT